MTTSNTQSPTHNQTEKIIEFLKYEIESLKFQLKKKDDRIASQDVILRQISESHSVEVRAYEDHRDKISEETPDLVFMEY